MNNDQKKDLIAWLNDAHSMELSLVENLEQKVKDADEEGDSEVRDRLNQHLDETRRHAELVKACVTRLGGKISKVKDIMGKLTGFMQGAMKSMYSDMKVKSALESYTAEQLEIASYTSLIAAAKEVGDMETADTCLEILKDEEKMAEWALDQVKIATIDHISVL